MFKSILDFTKRFIFIATVMVMWVLTKLWFEGLLASKGVVPILAWMTALPTSSVIYIVVIIIADTFAE